MENLKQMPVEEGPFKELEFSFALQILELGLRRSTVVNIKFEQITKDPYYTFVEIFKKLGLLLVRVILR